MGIESEKDGRDYDSLLKMATVYSIRATHAWEEVGNIKGRMERQKRSFERIIALKERRIEILQELVRNLKLQNDRLVLGSEMHQEEDPLSASLRKIGLDPKALNRLPSEEALGLIKAVFHYYGQNFHPDVNGGDAAKTERFKNITAAYHEIREELG